MRSQPPLNHGIQRDRSVTSAKTETSENVSTEKRKTMRTPFSSISFPVYCNVRTLP